MSELVLTLANHSPVQRPRDGAAPPSGIHGPGRLRGVETTNGEAGYCGACSRFAPEGPDPCLGLLPGVIVACCGHGNPASAYVIGQRDGARFLAEGPAALSLMRRLGD